MSLYNRSSLIQVPSLYKDGTLVSTIPEDRSGDFTVARGSNLAATRIGEDGYIKKGYENLLKYSNAFSTSPWISTSLTLTSGQSGYDGSSDAWLITKTASNGRVQQAGFGQLSGVYAISLYAKKNVSQWMRILGNASTNGDVFIDLENGVFGNASNVFDTNIESVGNGWYRCSFSANYSGIFEIRIYPADADGDTSGTTGSIYIQDAQLNQGLVAYPYLETTNSPVQGGLLENTPRLDWSNGVPALLLEPQRRNGITSSEDFTHSSWITQTGISVAQNTSDTKSPEGLYNAAKITSTNGSTGIYTSAFTTINPVTRSVYLKGENGGETLRIKDGSGNGGYAAITLTTEWVRYELKTNNDGLNYQGMYLDDISTSGAVYAYGAQYEEGSYPTSYIPTYGTSQTRLADDCGGAGDASTFNDSEGVLYAEIAALANDGTNRRIVISDGTFNNNVQLYYYPASNRVRTLVNSGGITSIDATAGLSDITIYHKFAIRYKTNDFSLWVDGVQVATDTSGNTPSGLNQLNFNDAGGSNFYGNVKQVLTFNTALSDDECIALTTIS